MSRSLIFCDSFDHADLTYQKWSIYSATGVDASWPAEGRTANCYKTTGVNTAFLASIGHNLFIPKARGLVGFAFKVDNASQFTTNSCLLAVYDGSTALWSLNVEQDGSMRAYRALEHGGGTLLATAGAVGNGQWAWVEAMWEIGAGSPTGRLLTRVNGIDAIDYSGDIDPAGLGQWTSFKLFPYTYTIAGGTVACWVDDFTLFEPSEVDASNFTGDLTVYPRRPNGIGNSSQWTPNGGSPAPDNYTRVDDVLPDGDTTIVSTGTTDALDLYQIEDVDADAEIIAVQVVAFAKKTDEGSAQIEPVFRIGGTDYTGTAQAVPATDYQVLTWPYDVSPDTAAAFTAAEFNAAESGPNKAA